MALGLLAAIPVVLSIGRNPDSRLYPRSRGALAGWGISLYLLGADAGDPDRRDRRTAGSRRHGS